MVIIIIISKAIQKEKPLIKIGAASKNWFIVATCCTINLNNKQYLGAIKCT